MQWTRAVDLEGGRYQSERWESVWGSERVYAYGHACSNWAAGQGSRRKTSGRTHSPVGCSARGATYLVFGCRSGFLFLILTFSLSHLVLCIKYNYSTSTICGSGKTQTNPPRRISRTQCLDANCLPSCRSWWTTTMASTMMSILLSMSMTDLSMNPFLMNPVVSIIFGKNPPLSASPQTSHSPLRTSITSIQLV